MEIGSRLSNSQALLLFLIHPLFFMPLYTLIARDLHVTGNHTVKDKSCLQHYLYIAFSHLPPKLYCSHKIKGDERISEE